MYLWAGYGATNGTFTVGDHSRGAALRPPRLLAEGLSGARSSLHRVNADLDYVGHVTRESARFAEVLRDVPPDVGVPSCPGWNADDLLWHLGEVQWFWGTVVREQVTGPQAEAWTWSDDHTVGFIRRRQAHEALIHRVDAELTAGTRTPLDPALAADGVD